MHEREAAREAIEIDDRILLRRDRPTDVELHLHERRIGVLEQVVVGHLAAEICRRHELEAVLVIRELQARLLQAFPLLLKRSTALFQMSGCLRSASPT